MSSSIKILKDHILPRLEEYLSLTGKGKELHSSCPFCGGNDKSDRFWVDVASQRFRCRSCEENGDILDMIERREGKSIKDLLIENKDEIERLGGKVAAPVVTKTKKSNSINSWTLAVPEHEAIYKYFENRGIFFKKKAREAYTIAEYGIPPGIRYSEFNDKKSGEKLTSIVFAMTNINTDKSVQAVARTYIDDNYHRTRKTMKGDIASKGRAIWFYRKRATKEKALVVGEGAETVLSAMQATGLNGVAAGTASIMLHIEYPKNVKKLYVLVDEDIRKEGAKKGYAGQKTSIKVAKNFEKMGGGRTAYLITPSDSCFSINPSKKDFNDISPPDIQDRFAKKIKVKDEVIVNYVPPDEDNYEEDLTNGGFSLDVSDPNGIFGMERATEYPAITIKALESVNKQFAAILLGGKFKIIRETFNHADNAHEITFIDKEAFKNFMMIKKVPVFTSTGGVRISTLPNVWMDYEGRRTYSGLVFAPYPGGKKPPAGTYNLFRGFPIKGSNEGSCEKFLWHMENVICNNNKEHYEYLLAWMARIVQEPGGDRPGVSIVLQGGKGTGKGTFVAYFGELFGESFLPIYNKKAVVGNFNMHLSKCILVFLDEAIWGGNKESEGALKSLITEPTILFEPKGIDSIKMRSYLNFIIASNEDWVVPTTEDERRFLVLRVSEDIKQDTDYFNDLIDEKENGGLEALMYYLSRYDYSGVNLRHAPKTEALADQVSISFNPVKKFWQDILYRGYILSDVHSGRPRKPDNYIAIDNEDPFWPGSVYVYELFSEYLFFCRRNNVKYVDDNRKFHSTLQEIWPEQIKIFRNDGDEHDRITLYNKKFMKASFFEITGINVDSGKQNVEKIPF